MRHSKLMPTVKRVARTVAALSVGAAVAVPGPAAAGELPKDFGCIWVMAEWDGALNIDLRIYHYSTTTYDSWTAHWTSDTPLTSLVNVWSAVMTLDSPHEVTARNGPRNGAIQGRGTLTTFGWSANPRSLEVPDDITVNGLPCPIREVWSTVRP